MDDKRENYPDPDELLKRTIARNYGPIMCLLMMRKILTAQRREEFYYSVVFRNNKKDVAGEQEAKMTSTFLSQSGKILPWYGLTTRRPLTQEPNVNSWASNKTTISQMNKLGITHKIFRRSHRWSKHAETFLTGRHTIQDVKWISRGQRKKEMLVQNNK